MKSAILLTLLAMATNTIAFEQIYAINAGGEAHTDADDIIYRKDVDREPHKWHWDLDIGDVPESDRDLYVSYVRTNNTGVLLRFNLPLKTDGFYVLIAKYFFVGNENEDIANMTLNDNIELLSIVDWYHQCGGNARSCDVYFYFCVAENILYHKNQSTLVWNEKIHIDIVRVSGVATISGLVLLKGDLGEHKKLTSSSTQESVDFDPAKMHPKCLKSVKRDCGEAYKNATDFFRSKIRSSIANVNQHLNLKTSCMEKVDQANRNIEVLKGESRKMQAEIKLRTDKMTREVQAEVASLKLDILDLSNQLRELRNLLLESAKPMRISSDDMYLDPSEN
jgi:Malectin domain